jgi:predicted unusual protein kinase regulating ubiquinone biosynthesis (AarF/ABC1/UbiB family)
LAAEWGADWRGQFTHFETTPIAAASIGQVHRATLPDGRALAVKVQYPGVARSIDADVDNVASLLRLSGIMPEGLDIAPLLAEAKRQLHEETDYRREAGQMRRYGAMLANDTRFVAPMPVDALSNARILAMDFLPGQPIEVLQAAPQAIRDSAMTALLGLVLRELFEFGFMQTDPNFANYRWQADTGRIVLLDFGAARSVPGQTVEAYRRLMGAGLAGDRDALRTALTEAGFISAAALRRHHQAIDDIMNLTIAHIGKPGPFDFADRSFVEPLLRHTEAIVADRAAWHVPPADTLFVQRKVSGMALLAVRMQARMPLREMASGVLSDPIQTS